jgi:hypothetical protein
MTLRFLSSCSTLSLLACACAPTATTSPALLTAAAPSPPPVRAEPPIAAVHRARCGVCHVRVEPGTRTREALTVAFERHRKRLHLAEDQWAALVDYLAE